MLILGVFGWLIMDNGMMCDGQNSHFGFDVGKPCWKMLMVIMDS
jgi:hypothetical protein